MYRVKRIISLLLTFVMAAALAPAALAETPYSITNGYLTYSYNADTGGFSIATVEGNPKKSYDNNIPLLYTEDETRSNGTSFITVRINDTDYIFGQDYNFYGVETEIGTPVVTDEGRLFTMDWTVEGITITQQVALGSAADTDTIGNAGMAFKVQNNSGEEANIGIRLLLDTALGTEIDAPYVMSSNATTPIYVETEYTGDAVPDQIRNLDSITEAKIMSYIIPKGWEGGTEPNKIIVGHWANLANTRYDYTPDKYCDFTNYSNEYKTPDAAVAVYWDSQTVAVGGSFSAETLYGVGNFSADTGDMVGLNMTAGRVSLNSESNGYENDGEVNVALEIDNTLDESIDLTGLTVIVATEEDCFEILSEDKITYDKLDKNNVTTETIKLKALPQSSITAGTVYVSFTSYGMVDGAQQIIETMTERSIIIPSVTGNKATVNMTAVNPATVYTEGEKVVTITGDMTAFKALESDSGWTLKLKQATSGHEVVIEKEDITFLDDTYTSLSFTTEEELTVGYYSIVFEFTDTSLVEAFGTSVSANVQLEVSADPIYALKTYSILSLVRITQNNNTYYDFYSFKDEGDYQAFYDGETAKVGLISGSTIKYDFGADVNATEKYEILLTVRGKVREMENTKYGTYWQADYADSPITINNILSYEGSEPIQMYKKDGKYVIEGDGLLKVVNSINVWRSEWNFTVWDQVVYTLNTFRTGGLTGGIDDSVDSRLPYGFELRCYDLRLV